MLELRTCDLSKRWRMPGITQKLSSIARAAPHCCAFASVSPLCKIRQLKQKVTEMEPMAALKAVCPTGTAEGESHFIEDAFVTPDEYSEIISPPTGSPRLLVGKKGSGKSILLAILHARCAAAGVPAILVRPDDLSFDHASTSDLATLKRNSYVALTRALASKLGSGLSGLVSDDDAKLFNHAVLEGERNPDTLQKLLQPLTRIAKVVTQIDFAQFVPTMHAEPSAALINALKSNLLRNSDRVVYVLVDDTDQVAAPTDSNQLNRIWSLILAARKLCELSQSLRVLITQTVSR